MYNFNINYIVFICQAHNQTSLCISWVHIWLSHCNNASFSFTFSIFSLFCSFKQCLCLLFSSPTVLNTHILSNTIFTLSHWRRGETGGRTWKLKGSHQCPVLIQLRWFSKGRGLFVFAPFELMSVLSQLALLERRYRWAWVVRQQGWENCHQESDGDPRPAGMQGVSCPVIFQFFSLSIRHPSSSISFTPWIM